MHRGFKIANILMNGQLSRIRGNLTDLQINLNISSNNKHMGEIKQLNLTVKKRVRDIYSTLPFKNAR